MFRIAHPQDFWSGLLFMAFGAFGAYMSRDFAFGALTRMGPGFLPTVLSWMLLGVGALVLARSLVLRGPAIAPSRIKPQVIIVAAIVLFALMIERVGLLPTIFAVTVVSAYASAEFRLRDSLLLAVGMAIACDVIFIRLLKLPMNTIAWNF